MGMVREGGKREAMYRWAEGEEGTMRSMAPNMSDLFEVRVRKEGGGREHKKRLVKRSKEEKQGFAHSH